MTKELTEQEYRGTMTGKMVNITETAAPVVDIWVYVRELAKQKLVRDIVCEKELVEYVYRDSDNKWHHALLPTGNENVFIVVIVDVIAAVIKGHYYLDLNKEYGL